MPRPFRLKRPIGPDSMMDPDDVLATKQALSSLGFLETPDYGLTPFPDQPMVGALKDFQRRHGLRVDGVMNPDGPTLKKLNDLLAIRLAHQPNQMTDSKSDPEINSSLNSSQENPIIDRPNLGEKATSGSQIPEGALSPRKPKQGIKMAAAGAAIPAIAGELPGILGAIASMLGLTLPLGRDTPKDDESGRRCDEQYEQDSEICRRVSAEDGPQVAQRCWESASLRYGNCLAGRPVPDLDRGTD